jgi:hypothetical protein
MVFIFFPEKDTPVFPSCCVKSNHITIWKQTQPHQPKKILQRRIKTPEVTIGETLMKTGQQYAGGGLSSLIHSGFGRGQIL